MNIGIVPDPLNDPDWPQIEAFLEPAAKLGNVPILEEHEEVWAVYGNGLEAAATARLTSAGTGEIILCGGRNARNWAEPLSDAICDWFTTEERKLAHIFGRRGWLKLLPKWQVIGEREGVTIYERAL